MGPKTGFASDVLVTIYLWVSTTLLAVVIHQPATAIDQYPEICRYYGVIIPSFLSIAGGVGFCILNSILGGQTLASIANISWT